MRRYNTLSRWHIEQLRYRTEMSIQDYEVEGVTSKAVDGLTTVFKDNGADILAIAHRDTVQTKRTFHHEGMTIWNPQLDDRLGAFVIMDLLSDLKFDILLTEGEETGRSTAKNFVVPEGKKYKWMFQFDRAGVDCVMYQYDTPYLRNALMNAAITPGNGSFSDIAAAGHVGCSGFNMGVGYYNNHSLDAFMRIDHMMEQVGLFRRFYDRYYDTYFIYKQACKTCGSTKSIDRRGFCPDHGFQNTNHNRSNSTSVTRYNDSWYQNELNGYYNTAAKGESKSRNNFDWDGKGRSRTHENPLFDADKEAENYGWM